MHQTIETLAAQALDLLSVEARASMVIDPVGTMSSQVGLIVRPVDHLDEARDDGGVCDGVSYLQDRVVLYRPSPMSRRENFTLAHELAHWLVDQVEGSYDWAAAQRDPGHALETLCDAVAAELLLPSGLVARVVGSEPVRAHHLVELFAESQASWPACAIGLKKALPCLGAIVLLRTGASRVEFATVKPHAERGWPAVAPWSGQPVPAGHPLSSLTAGGKFTGRTHWRTPWGAEAQFYLDAESDERRTIGVLAQADLWDCERFHGKDDRVFDTRLEGEVRCCGELRLARGYPCAQCGTFLCPVCGDCQCDRRSAREERCAGTCFMQFPAHLLVDGLCETCRE